METKNVGIKEIKYTEEILPRLHIEDDEYLFDEDNALALLLLKGVVFVNNHWWEEDWPEDSRESFGIYVSCNDIFAWACSGAEELKHKDLEDLYNHWEKDPDWGSAIWCIKKRGEMPQRPIYERIQALGIWNLDEMNLSPNRYDEWIKNY